MRPTSSPTTTDRYPKSRNRFLGKNKVNLKKLLLNGPSRTDDLCKVKLFSNSGDMISVLPYNFDDPSSNPA